MSTVSARGAAEAESEGARPTKARPAIAIVVVMNFN